MKILCSEFMQRVFENKQQIFRVTMHTTHTFIEHPNHQIGYITMTKTVKGTEVNAHSVSEAVKDQNFSFLVINAYQYQK